MEAIKSGTDTIYRYIFNLDTMKFSFESYDCKYKEYYFGNKYSHTAYIKKDCNIVFNKNFDKIMRSWNLYTMYSLDSNKMEDFKEMARNKIYILAYPCDRKKKEYDYKEIYKEIFGYE